MGDKYRPRAGYGVERARDGEYYGRDPYYDDRQRYADSYEPSGRDGYTFRGAAERQPERYRPHEDFSFRAQGPPAPRFPPAEHFPPPQHSSRRQHEHAPRHNGPRAMDQARQRHAQSQRGRGGFRGRAAHKREILRADRETTPEQLEGMNMDGHTRFLDIVSVSSGSESGEVIDLTNDSDDGGVDLPRKRVKFDVAAEPTVPKWSNPDPYTVLPPPETLGAPKKDIVQTIRKAKTDKVSKNSAKNAVQENVDFISFNFDDDDDSDDDQVSNDNMSMDLELADLAAVEASRNVNGFSHRTDLHSKIPSAQMQDPSFTPINGVPQRLPGGKFVVDDVPVPPPGFVMPTDEELMDQYANDGKSTKRKRRDGHSKAKGDIVDEWDANETDPTPWCTVDHSRTSNVALRLHKEICDFYDFVRPYDYEEAVRRDLIDRIELAIRTSSAKSAQSVSLHCFGSFAAGLYLPTADMDLVAVSPEYMNGGRRTFAQSGTQMHKIKNHFEYGGVAPPDGVVVIARAKVPIIKFPDKLTGIKVDISFENDSGIVANDIFQQWKTQYPAMPVVVVLVKQLLAMRNLNEVYTGGIGGFTTICLVVSMMQLMPELQSDSADPRLHYGELLMNFLDLYGNKFDIRSTGIRMEPPGYFNKISNPAPKQNPDRLTIIDPNNPVNDISGGSHEIDTVLNAFRHAHAALQRRLAQIHAGQKVEDSILGCMWGGNYTSFIRQREKLSVIHRGYAVSPPPPPAPKPARKGTANGAGKERWPKGKKQPAASSREQPQQIMRGPESSRPLHSLPSRPNGQAHPLPPRPTTRNHSASVQNGDVANTADSQPPRSTLQRDSTNSQRLTNLDKAQQKAKSDRKARNRAEAWKAAHPHVQISTEKMTKSQVRKLNLRHAHAR